jgi:hypothetical protein
MITKKYKEVTVQKGQETNKLSVLRELMSEMGDLFERVKEDDPSKFDAIQDFFGGGYKTVSKVGFKATLTIEIVETQK